MQYYFGNIVILYFNNRIEFETNFPNLISKIFILSIRNIAYKVNYIAKIIVNMIFLFKFSIIFIIINHRKKYFM